MALETIWGVQIVHKADHDIKTRTVNLQTKVLRLQALGGPLLASDFILPSCRELVAGEERYQML